MGLTVHADPLPPDQAEAFDAALKLHGSAIRNFRRAFRLLVVSRAMSLPEIGMCTAAVLAQMAVETTLEMSDADVAETWAGGLLSAAVEHVEGTIRASRAETPAARSRWNSRPGAEPPGSPLSDPIEELL